MRHAQSLECAMVPFAEADALKAEGIHVQAAFASPSHDGYA